MSEGSTCEVADPGVEDKEGDVQGSDRISPGGAPGEHCKGYL